MRAMFTVLMISMIACSGADESSVMGPRGSETNDTTPTTNTSTTQPKDGEDPKPAGEDASTPKPPVVTDAGSPDAKPPVDTNPFSGAPAYVNTLGPSARKTQHPFTNDNPRGRACLDCHDGAGNAPAMAFGGTVFTTAAGTTGAARVEVRVKDKDGKAISAWSDADGNFYFLVNPNGDLNLPGHAGIRNAKGSKVMSSALAEGNCNGCHNANGAGRLVAPN